MSVKSDGLFVFSFTCKESYGELIFQVCEVSAEGDDLLEDYSWEGEEIPEGSAAWDSNITFLSKSVSAVLFFFRNFLEQFAFSLVEHLDLECLDIF